VAGGARAFVGDDHFPSTIKTHDFNAACVEFDVGANFFIDHFFDDF
jgi:hypothetical protein